MCRAGGPPPYNDAFSVRGTQFVPKLYRPAVRVASVLQRTQRYNNIDIQTMAIQTSEEMLDNHTTYISSPK